MKKFLCNFVILSLGVATCFAQGIGSGNKGNLRLCVVEGRGSYKKAGKFCPILDEENSGVECVIGTDRLDCLRRMSKGTVDFGVFSPEDLIAAQWANLDVLVTNELRNKLAPFERNIVALVNRRILPESVSPIQTILRNTTLCHQGHGADDMRGMSDALAEYLLSLVTPKSCQANMSLTKNRIHTMSQFFRQACKAGPWVLDKQRDLELKSKYPSLCAACVSQCSSYDRHWGVLGSLACMVDGGELAWAQLQYVQMYYGLLPGSTPYGSPDHFAYLCRDGSWQPLVNNTEPCVWLNRPWPVVVAKRKTAAAVSALAFSLTNSSVAIDTHWRGALASLMEIGQEATTILDPQKAPLDYLSQAYGFREAYSQMGCSPPRYISLCATSILEKNKCDWLSEAAAVYGITPPLQCEYRDTKEDCFKEIRDGKVDVTIAESDWFIRAKRDYSAEALLYETTPIVEQTNTVLAYVKDDSISSFQDLRGKRAIFPRFDSVAWHSVMLYLSKSDSQCKNKLSEFFSVICAPGIENAKNLTEGVKQKYTESCLKDNDKVLSGEKQALRSLIEGGHDVAFISLATYKKYAANLIDEPWARQPQKLKPICPDENKTFCFISWSSLGYVFASNKTSDLRRHEIINHFTNLDHLFGKNYPFHSPLFSMYSQFNHKFDIIFHNNTRSLSTASVLETHPFDKIPMNFERSITKCQFEMFSNSGSFGPSWILVVTFVVSSMILFR